MVDVCVHRTGLCHIDGVAVATGSGLTALATSSLTGDFWDGKLVLLSGLDGEAAKVVHTEPTASGNAGLAWVTPELLATGDDRGDVVIWQVNRGSAAETGAAATDGDAGAAEAAMTRLVSFGEHTQPVTAVATHAAAAAPRVASTSLDGTAKVWTAAVAGGATASLEHLSQRTTW